MFRTTKIWACAGLLAAATATSAAAQTPLFGGTLYREFDVGGRTANGVADTARQFFNLYRDVNSGLLLQNLRLWYVSEDGKTFWDAYARDAGLLDQRYHARFERFGRFRFTFDHDETPHFISSDARMPAGALTSGDSLGLPTPRPDTNTWKASPIVGDVSMATRDTRAALDLTPSANVDLAASWDHVGRTGQKPMGMTFQGSSGPAREGFEPIDNSFDRFRVAPSIARQKWQATLSYEYSGYNNNYTAVMMDNPARATSSTAGSAIGQAGLAPDNQAHTFAGSAGYSFTNTSRLTMAGSYSVRYQNAAFLPRTVNAALDTSKFGAMPASLDGSMHTAMANVTFTTRLDPTVTFAARYSYFNLGDATPAVSFLGRVNADRQVQLQQNTREQYPYSRQTLTAELTWRASRTATVRLADNVQTWSRERDVREVAHTTEHLPKLSLLLAPLDWLDIRTSVSAGARWGDGYMPVTAGNNRWLVRYDEANKVMRRFDFDGQVTPLANTTIGVQYGTSRQNYDQSRYGLQKDNYDVAGIDASWAPSARFSLTAGAMRQVYDQLLRSQYRTGANPSNPTLDWITDDRDTVTSYDVSVDVVVMPRKLEAGLTYSEVHSTTSLDNSNPLAAKGVDAATATASRVTLFPQMSYDLKPLSAVVRYHFSPTLTLSARYTTEDFAGNDFRSGGLAPYLNNMYYLGNFPQGYGAQYFTFTVSYRPWVPGLRHAVM